MTDRLRAARGRQIVRGQIPGRGSACGHAWVCRMTPHGEHSAEACAAFGRRACWHARQYLVYGTGWSRSATHCRTQK